MPSAFYTESILDLSCIDTAILMNNFCAVLQNFQNTSMYIFLCGVYNKPVNNIPIPIREIRKFRYRECQQLAAVKVWQTGNLENKLVSPESKSQSLYHSPCPESVIFMPLVETEIAFRSSAYQTIE